MTGFVLSAKIITMQINKLVTALAVVRKNLGIITEEMKELLNQILNPEIGFVPSVKITTMQVRIFAIDLIAMRENQGNPGRIEVEEILLQELDVLIVEVRERVQIEIRLVDKQIDNLNLEGGPIGKTTILEMPENSILEDNFRYQ